MFRYRISGTRSYTCSDPDGDAKSFSREFDAERDDDVPGMLPGLRGPGEVWHDPVLVRIDVREVATPVSL